MMALPPSRRPWKPPHPWIKIHIAPLMDGLQRAADAVRVLSDEPGRRRIRLRAMHATYRRKTRRRKP